MTNTNMMSTSDMDDILAKSTHPAAKRVARLMNPYCMRDPRKLKRALMISRQVSREVKDFTAVAEFNRILGKTRRIARILRDATIMEENDGK